MSEYIDASIQVKWFKSGERNHHEALRLRERMFRLDTEFVMNEYGILEIVRALVKAGFPQKQINECFKVLTDSIHLGAVKVVHVSDVIVMAKDIQIALNLYASDAVHVASSIHEHCSVLWSEDAHHLREKTKNYLAGYGIQVRSLVESPQ